MTVLMQAAAYEEITDTFFIQTLEDFAFAPLKILLKVQQ